MMAEKTKRNLALDAFREHYDSLHSAISQPDMVSGLASKVYKKAIITRDTRNAVQLATGSSPAQRGAMLLQAIETAIQSNQHNLHQFVQILRKEPSLKPLGDSLWHYYSK